MSDETESQDWSEFSRKKLGSTTMDLINSFNLLQILFNTSLKDHIPQFSILLLTGAISSTLAQHSHISLIQVPIFKTIRHLKAQHKRPIYSSSFSKYKRVKRKNKAKTLANFNLTPTFAKSYKAKPFKYSGSRLALSWNFLNHLSRISMGTTNLDPSTPQNDCMKLNKFSPTFKANRSIFFSAATSSEGNDAKSSTETPILAERGCASAVS